MAKKNNSNNLLMRFADYVADIIFLSIFWVVGCMPILTIGASTTALYYATMKAIRDEGSISRNFFKSYKENFRQSVLVELIALLLVLLLYTIIKAAASIEGFLAAVLHILVAILLFLCVTVANYLFPLLSRFNQTIPVLFRNAFLISFSNLPRTVGITILNLIPFIAFLIWPAGFMRLLLVMLFLVPGLVARLNSIILMRVFMKYEPQSKLDNIKKTGD